MEVKKAIFNGTFVRTEDCPKTEFPEYAFIGRSNVGKSSLINYICNYKGLAKVSSTPGKTKTINYFLVNEQWQLVDLPGYGFAKSSKTEKEKWSKMTHHFLENRTQIKYLFVLIDSRIPPQKSDLEFINYLGSKSIPFVLTFTKADKPGGKDTLINVELFKREMLKTWDDLPMMFITSSEKKYGKEQLLLFIDQVNKE